MPAFGDTCISKQLPLNVGNLDAFLQNNFLCGVGVHHVKDTI